MKTKLQEGVLPKCCKRRRATRNERRAFAIASLLLLITVCSHHGHAQTVEPQVEPVPTPRTIHLIREPRGEPERDTPRPSDDTEEPPPSPPTDAEAPPPSPSPD